MALEEFEKQPGEAFVIAADFVNVINQGESIVEGNCSVTAWDIKAKADVSPQIITAGSLTADGTQLKIQVQGGTDKKSYQITFKIETDATPANKWEVDAIMKVLEE